MLLQACTTTAPAPQIEISDAGLSDAKTRLPVDVLRLPVDATVMIYLHGTRNPVNREDCQYRNNRVPESIQSVAQLPNTFVFFLCSEAVDGPLEGSYIQKRSVEVRQVLARLIEAGISPDRLFLAGHSAGAWTALMLMADNASLFNGLIGFAPACCGRRDLEADYPRWRGQIRPRQVEQMLTAERIDALLFAYDDDIYNRPADLAFLPAAYPDSVQLVGYACEAGHNTHIDDCRVTDTGRLIRDFITRQQAGQSGNE